MSKTKVEYRLESDAAGEMKIPANALWGIQSARFISPLIGLKPHPQLIQSLVLIKKAAAQINADNGGLTIATSSAIIQAADEVLHGQWQDNFLVDALQPNCATALNCNTNEILANRASEILGGVFGPDALVLADRHVNQHQSTTAVFTIAVRLAILLSWKDTLPLVLDLERLLRRKSLEFDKLQNPAVARIQGQQFNAFGASIEHNHRHINAASSVLLELPSCSTASDSKADTAVDFDLTLIERLSEVTNLRLQSTEDSFCLQQSLTDFSRFSSSLKDIALNLVKMVCHLRFMFLRPLDNTSQIVQADPLLEPLSPDVACAISITDTLTVAAYQIIANDTAISFGRPVRTSKHKFIGTVGGAQYFNFTGLIEKLSDSVQPAWYIQHKYGIIPTQTRLQLCQLIN